MRNQHLNPSLGCGGINELCPFSRRLEPEATCRGAQRPSLKHRKEKLAEHGCIPWCLATPWCLITLRPTESVFWPQAPEQFQKRTPQKQFFLKLLVIRKQLLAAPPWRADDWRGWRWEGCPWRRDPRMCFPDTVASQVLLCA